MDEGKEPEEETNVPTQDIPFGAYQQQSQQQKVEEPHYMNPEDHKSDTNLIKMAANGQTPPKNYSSTTNTTVNNTLNSDNNADNKVKEPLRTYIPSPEGMVQNSIDMSAYDKAMSRADMAEKFINDTLASMNG